MCRGKSRVVGAGKADWIGLANEAYRFVWGMKKYVLMFLAYVTLTFAIAVTWHLVLFRDIYDQLAIFTRKEPIIPLGLASMIMQGVVLACLFPLVSRSGAAWKEGLRFGLLIGVLMASIAVFAEAGKQQVSSLSTWLILESVYYLLQFGCVGVALAFVHRAATKQRAR